MRKLISTLFTIGIFFTFYGIEDVPGEDHVLLAGGSVYTLDAIQNPSAKKHTFGKKDGFKIAFPGKIWKEKSPLSQGVDPAALDSAIKYFDEHSGGCGTREMVIVRNGFIIWKGRAADTLHAVFSCTKIFTSSVMGLLATEGKLEVTDFAEKYLLEITEGNLGQETYKTLRLMHLASMSGGYDPVRTDCWDLHLQGRHEESLECTKGYIIPGKPRFSPGTHWSYRDPEVHMLGHILTSISGKSLYDLFKHGIADKIGMSDWKWSDYGTNRQGILFNNPAGTPNDTDVDDINIFQAGIWITPLDFARLGLLYLCGGKWKGTELLDPDFTRMAITNRIAVETPAIGIDNTGRYGFYWWTNGVQKNGKRPWPSAPPSTSTAHGNGSNFCYVVPEWNMVIVRMSPHNKSQMGPKREEIWEGFFSRLKPGIK